MLITQQKRTQVLTKQIQKLHKINSLQLINNHFWLGYISAYIIQPLQLQQITHFMHVLHNAANLSNDGLFTENNIMEIILTAIDTQVCSKARNKWVEKSGMQIKKVSDFIKSNVDELSFNNQYLANKYFKQEEEKVIPPSQVNRGNSDLGLQCLICAEPITFSTVCTLSCNHLIHKNCFQQHIKYKVENKSFPIICPMEKCQQQIPVVDIQQYIQGETLKKYYDFSMHMLVDAKSQLNWCPTAGCQAVFELQNYQQFYACPSCNHKYCLKCRTQAHQKMTCEEYRQLNNLSPDEKSFLSFVKGQQYKQCPSCKFWVSKNRGCDHMTCRCTYQFCYRCGAKYGTCSCEENSSFYNSGSQDQQMSHNSQEMNHSI